MKADGWCLYEPTGDFVFAWNWNLDETSTPR